MRPRGLMRRMLTRPHSLNVKLVAVTYSSHPGGSSLSETSNRQRQRQLNQFGVHSGDDTTANLADLSTNHSASLFLKSTASATQIFRDDAASVDQAIKLASALPSTWPTSAQTNLLRNSSTSGSTSGEMFRFAVN